jgi:hypothetical protein
MHLQRTLAIGAAVAAVAFGVAQARPHHDLDRCYTASHYTNVSGHCVHRPELVRSEPLGWTAQCRDGSYSLSEHRRGTCSHHGGVARWR